jgi:hypothetical protein
MDGRKPIRIIKRENKAKNENAAKPPRVAAPNPEREVKTVVSGWVREHARRSEEFRRTFAKLLTEVGLTPSRSTGRA